MYILRLCVCDLSFIFFSFFFQAEDGIRDGTVTGVQTCALPIFAGCALKGDVRKVELQVQALRGDAARSDSVRAAERDSTLAAVRAVQQALTTQQAYLVQL